MEVAGLVIGAISMVTAWNTCVQAFDAVSSVKSFGFDHEIIQVKLEVERVRLLAWGEMVGLANVQPNQLNPERILDQRLNREDMRATILRLLGCIQHVFNDTDSLQRKYGLKRDGAGTGNAVSLGITSTEGGQLVLSSIFKRAYTNLQKSAKDYQQNTPLRLRTRWAITDKAKFLGLVTEIRGFNNSLVSLFPDVTSKTAARLHEDIDTSDEIGSLLLLQQAAVNDNEDISESASQRLHYLGATVTDPSIAPPDDDKTETRSITPEAPEAPEVPKATKPAHPEWDIEIKIIEDNKPPEFIGLEKEIDRLSVFCEKKSRGALTCGVTSFGNLARCSSSVYWHGDQATDKLALRDSDDKLKGFAPSTHSAFDIYRKKRFIKKAQRDECDSVTDEDHVLLDVEADPQYDNRRPGTITIEGFALECWEYEKMFGTSDEKPVFVTATDLPTIPTKKLLRRIHELQTLPPDTLGWSTERDLKDLKEFTGLPFARRHDDKLGQFSELYALLNRRDDLVDLPLSSSVMVAFTVPKSSGIWTFLWQVIVGYELARRLQRFPDTSISGFTEDILATLIISDRWINNVGLILADRKESAGEKEERESREVREAKEADLLKEKGNAAMKKKDYETAINFYAQAIEITPKNPVLLSNIAAAFISIQEHELACEAAQAAVDADPTFTKAWGRLGLAKLELKDAQGSMEAYKRGMDSDSKGGSAIMKQGYETAKRRLQEEQAGKTSTIEKPTESFVKKTEEKKKQESNPQDDAWDNEGKMLEWHSLVHEKQVEGLLRFAEILKWPFMNETRDFAEDIYSNLRGGSTVAPDIWDWIYGIVLPGRWTAYKIVAVLVLSTPSLSKEIGTAKYFDSGLSLPKQSYWRSRTVLGRVLGSLPGIKSVCGWVGPCPPIEGPHRKYIRVKARRVAPPKHEKNMIQMGPSGPDKGEESIRMKEGEDVHQWMAEIKDESNWATPQPPVQQMTSCSLVVIHLKKLPMDSSVVSKSSKMSKIEIDHETEYRASISFKIDNETPVKYTLYTNPVFVTLPACKNPRHPVHSRELPKFGRNIWNVEELKGAESADYDDNGLIVINATGKGAETVARAWCSERGKNAAIRCSGGPCFVCAYDAASAKYLGLSVLIWVS